MFRRAAKCAFVNCQTACCRRTFWTSKPSSNALREAINPDLVLTHHGLDRHQDHSLVSQVTWQTFRDHMIWEYEIPKFDGDLATPNMYVPLPSALAARKIALIMRFLHSMASRGSRRRISRQQCACVG